LNWTEKLSISIAYWLISGVGTGEGLAVGESLTEGMRESMMDGVGVFLIEIIFESVGTKFGREGLTKW